jgi:hypothetical protein
MHQQITKELGHVTILRKRAVGYDVCVGYDVKMIMGHVNAEKITTVGQ